MKIKRRGLFFPEPKRRYVSIERADEIAAERNEKGLLKYRVHRQAGRAYITVYDPNGHYMGELTRW